MGTQIKGYSLPVSTLTKSKEFRFDAGHYSPDLFHVLNILDRSGLRLERLSNIVESVVLPPRFKRVYVEQDEGLPFLQGSHVVHFQPADLKYLSQTTILNIDRIVIHSGWLLITRSGTVGRVTLCPPEWNGWAASEHIIRVIPDESKCPTGYLCAFLSSLFGQVQLRANIHGAVVDELTDKQVENVLVPLPENEDWELLRSIDTDMKQATEWKSRAVASAHASVNRTISWLSAAGDRISRNNKDIRISNATPEKLAKALMSGGEKPRLDTKMQKAS